MKSMQGMLLALMLLANSQAEARFLAPDPVKPDLNTGQNFNRYGYANNNPVKYLDIDGQIAELHWTAKDKVTATIRWTMTGEKTNFTPEEVNAQIAKDFSGSAIINDVKVSVTAQGIYESIAESKNLNTVNVVADTEGVTQSGRSETDKIGGSSVTIGATGTEAATTRTVSHELGGHASGAGDQYNGGVDASGKVLSGDVSGPSNVMKDLSGQPANTQSLTEIIKASTNVNTCAPNVSAGNGGC